MDTLSATFAALADPTRRAILSRLAMGPANVTELALPFDISQPAISKHLKILERAGLIQRGREAQSRPCSIDATPIREVAGWAEGYRALVAAVADALPLARIAWVSMGALRFSPGLRTKVRSRFPALDRRKVAFSPCSLVPITPRPMSAPSGGKTLRCVQLASSRTPCPVP